MSQSSPILPQAERRSINDMKELLVASQVLCFHQLPWPSSSQDLEESQERGLPVPTQGGCKFSSWFATYPLPACCTSH